MKKVLYASLLSLSFAAGTNADTLGFEIGAAAWASQQKIGKAPSQKTKTEANGSVYASFEHPIIFLPNIRVEYMNNSNDVRHASKIESDTSYADLTLYYQLLDNWVNLDLGIDVRRMDAEYKQPGSSAKANSTLGALYLGAQFDLPLTGLSIGASASHSGGVSKNRDFRDYNAYLRYQMGFGFGLQTGYRLQEYSIKYNNGVGRTELDVKGAYLQAFWAF